MRSLGVALLLAGMLAGCSSPPAADGEPLEEAPAPAAQAPAEPVVIGQQTFQLGLPYAGPVQVSVAQGLEVPANMTHLRIDVHIAIGGSLNLEAFGLEGCEHTFGLVQKAMDSLSHECDAPAGPGELRLRIGGGRIQEAHLTVTAFPDPVAAQS